MHRARLPTAARPLHVLCACDTFKGTLPSDKVGEAVEAGYRQVWTKLQQMQADPAHPLMISTNSTGSNLPHHSLPPVTVPPQSEQLKHPPHEHAHHTSAATTALPAAAVIPGGLLAHSLVAGIKIDSTTTTTTAAAAATSFHAEKGENTAAVQSAAMPAVFAHTPMSDGGAGLLDSVTFASSLAAHTHPQHAEKLSLADPHSTTVPQANTESPASGVVAGTAPTPHPPSLSADALNLKRVYIPATVPITGPLGTPIVIAAPSANAAGSPVRSGAVSFACDVARRVLVVEMAEAAGLPRIARPHDRDPTRTTSYGVGEIITYALAYMADAIAAEAAPPPPRTAAATDGEENTGVRLFLGIGGSSTNDGGLGALQALGLEVYVHPTESFTTASASDAAASFARTILTEEEVLLTEPLRGGDLARLARVRVGDKMRRVFPYLPQDSSAGAQDQHANGGKTGEGEGVSSTAGAQASSSFAASGKDRRLHIREVCLICDVDNPLVGPHGATYTFGPQKCAPPASVQPKHIDNTHDRNNSNTNNHSRSATASDSNTAAEVGDDAAVGAITSDQQRALLDGLEAGMRHAASRVVASTWQQLAHPSQLNPAPSCEDAGEEAAVLADLLYRPGGGGAGGMSGFFRYVLHASYVPGADMVGGLLGLYETPYVSHLLGSDGGRSNNNTGSSVRADKMGDKDDDDDDDENTKALRASLPVRSPRGCLFHACDVVVSGEGSFDDQTISSHKTVGRLLEMCTAANAYRLWATFCHVAEQEGSAPVDVEACHVIQDFVVVCGRSGFEDYTTCQSTILNALCSTLLLSRAPAAPADTGSEKKKNNTADDSLPAKPAASADLDVRRVNTYLDDLVHAPAFHRYCEAHNKPLDTPTAECVLRNFCVPRVTVLPLTPTLFSFADATQKSYSCVTSAVVDLLEEAVRQTLLA